MTGGKLGRKAGGALQKVKSALNLKKQFSKINLREHREEQSQSRQQTTPQDNSKRPQRCKCLGAKPGDPPNIGLQNLTNEEMREVMDAAERALAQTIDHGFIGGGALHVYGQQRGTKDLDILVPDGQVQLARDMLKQNSGRRFDWDPLYSQDHMWYEFEHRCVNIDVMSPRLLGLPENFLRTANGERIEFKKRRLVHPRGLIQLKSIARQSRAPANDVEDLLWL